MSSSTPVRRFASSGGLRSRYACLVALISMASTAAPAQNADVEGEGGAHIPPFTYYQVTRPDPRLCPAPACGGVFVKRVNRARSRCVDGTLANECHAAQVDWSALGLSGEDQAALAADFVARRVLVRGELASLASEFGVQLPTLVVFDAWRGATGSETRGRVWGVTDSGIVCITHPCPIYSEIQLNSRRARFMGLDRSWDRPLHGLDLSRVGASGAEVTEAFRRLSPEGLLVAGRHRRVRGPAGRGRELVASGFYLRVIDDPPRVCGGFTYPPNSPCGEGFFCDPHPGTCLIADLPGICVASDDFCTLHSDPVCGCDGVSYGNDCERRRARVGLDHEGPCQSGGDPCGAAVCGPGTQCCNPLLDLCAPPGVACVQ